MLRDRIVGITSSGCRLKDSQPAGELGVTLVAALCAEKELVETDQSVCAPDSQRRKFIPSVDPGCLVSEFVIPNWATARGLRSINEELACPANAFAAMNSYDGTELAENLETSAYWICLTVSNKGPAYECNIYKTASVRRSVNDHNEMTHSCKGPSWRINCWSGTACYWNLFCD